MRKMMVMLLFIPILAFSQPPVDETIYLAEASRIMDTFNIKKRPKIHLDAKLSYKVHNDTSNRMGGSFGGIRAYDGDTTSDNLYFLHPTVFFGELSDSIIRRKLNRGDINYGVAESTLIHEYTHYLQYKQPDSLYNKYERNHEKIYKHEIEFEAAAVGGYYFLEKYRPDILAEIMRLPIKKYYKMVQIIKVYHFIKTRKILSLDGIPVNVSEYEGQLVE